MNREIQTRKKIGDTPFLMHYHHHGTHIYLRSYWYLIFMPRLISTCADYERLTPFDEDRLIEIGIDLSYSLSACHTDGIIHRDVKPVNVFLISTEQFEGTGVYEQYLRSKKWPVCVLGDFGIAKDTTRSDLFTNTGTTDYKSRELRENDLELVNRYKEQQDIFSLGALLYWCANGHTFPARTVDISVNSGSEYIQKPANASDDMWRIICRATQIQPQDRYTSAWEMRNDLRQLRIKRGLLEEESALLADRLETATQEKERQARDAIAAIRRLEAERDEAKNALNLLKAELSDTAADKIAGKPLIADKALSRTKTGVLKKKRSRGSILILTIILVLNVSLALNFLVIQPLVHYNRGMRALEEMDYRTAATEFDKAGNWKDAKERYAEAEYLKSEEIYG